MTSVTALLDPVLTPFGFAPGQTGGHNHSGQIIWCAAYTEFAADFPWLPQAETDLEPVDYLCTDLIVELDRGHVVDVSLEGDSVEKTFRAVSRGDDATAVAALIGQPADRATVALVRLLPRLFVPPS